jgi:hypothetical protein
MNSFVSVFVSQMSGQCQKYVVNFEGVGIPPKLRWPAEKESRPQIDGGVPFPKKLGRFFAFFLGRSLGLGRRPWRSDLRPFPCAVPPPVPLVWGKRFAVPIVSRKICP